MINQQDYIELGGECAKVCILLGRGLEGKSLDKLSDSVLKAIDDLTA